MYHRSLPPLGTGGTFFWSGASANCLACRGWTIASNARTWVKLPPTRTGRRFVAAEVNRTLYPWGVYTMAKVEKESKLSRQKLIELLNEDLEREYQAIISYVVYSQVLKGAEYMNIADELEVHAGEELQHAITLANQIDYLGGMPKTTPKPVKTSDKAKEMLKFDLENENETIRNYRIRVKQCEELGEYALAEQIRDILVQEQDHQIALATALGVDVPDVTSPKERA